MERVVCFTTAWCPVTEFFLRISAAVALLGLWSLPASACSTPVFQYALENWPADPYQLIVRHHGLDEEQLEGTAGAVLVPEDGAGVNMQLQIRQDDALDEGTGRVELHFPFHPRDMPPILDQPYSADILRQLADSPVRQQLVKSLLGDATAVFLFLQSGSEEADQAARRRLREILAELEANLELPFVPVDSLDQEAPTEAPPRVRFPVIELEADDPDEAVLRHVLLSTESDLSTFNEPMVFPVFGRGRALYAIVGRGINRDVLIEACLFITGACSCQVKAQNPGVDLPLRAGWDRFLQQLPYEEIELPPLTGVASMAQAEEEPAAPGVPVEEALADADRAAGANRQRRSVLTWAVIGAVAVAVLGVAAGTLVVFLRQGAEH